MIIITFVLIAMLLIATYPILNIVLFPIIGCSIVILLCLYGLICIFKERFLL